MPSGAAPHRPGPGRVVPSATYRLQVQPDFTFGDAADQADYLAALGISHVYLSPILAAAPGSVHGYDVVSHEFLNEELGGSAGFDRLTTQLRTLGLGAVVDVVPNHMTTPTPASLNHPWWFLLRDGRESDHAHWFDVDWEAEDGRVLVPVLGQPLESALAAGELTVETGVGPHGHETVLRYYDHVFPVRPGTESLELPELVAAQHYRLCDWREGGSRLNYRRFFDVTTLAAVRVEDDDVFDHTHRLLLEEFRVGTIDGFRIDHPDGLADPGRYLARLADATGDAWVVAEKILEGDEQLPDDWRCAGTTGYDTLLRVQQVFVDRAGEQPLTELLTELGGEQADLHELVSAAKEQVVAHVQEAEVNRLMRLAGRILVGEDQDALRRGLEALLVSMDRYRAYLVPGRAPAPDQLAVLAHAEARAAVLLPEHDRDALAMVGQLAAGGHLPGAQPDTRGAQREFVVRFQQTCGPVMAKGIEDTAFYRYPRLTGLNEVGGDPGHLGVVPDELHAFASRQLATWPTTMTTASTHDTKRSEDVRARLSVVSELPQEWAQWVREARDLAAPHRGTLLDGPTEYLLWQTVVGAWPISTSRLQAYATKAVREAKQHTTWTAPDPGYEADVAAFVEAMTTDPAVTDHVGRWVERTAPAARVNTLGQKLLQLVLPGVPDVYQGTELVDLSLVDPDNRRPVDYASRRARLARLDGGDLPRDLDDEKLLLTSRALRLRHAHPEWFTGDHATYAAVPTSSEHALAVGRGDGEGVHVVTVVTRLSEGLRSAGGWGAATVTLPDGDWVDLLAPGSDRPPLSGEVELEGLLRALPVALLVRHGSLDPR
ncbi:(1-_4)-alpha-D-glucan 1-alpha-D-glucosylmutase [Phycicoccus badiiscoriae]|uniref:(1->4)-alpha-D-glucan 1-alpha-D-glucosylmutase n=1 Tax=Pedococcus badiiscoriae TaxID=642776 RepID=A0A852WMF8_9MICO|nr:malto-oligosyltrehalose synthase [Pedococcus badiiscoriae]NYG07994.1 (1->4)-alpha-D-glucan 1-alpha-D-glucosylmutase [Pedococcus badiiscoriae]